MTAKLLEIKNLCVDFRQPDGHALAALKNIDLDLHAGELLAVVGESGSGKSTLAKTLVGLVGRTSGEVMLDGKMLPAHFSSSDFRLFAKAMQMVFQDPLASLNPRWRVERILAEPFLLTQTQHGSKDTVFTSLRAKLDKLLDSVGLQSSHLSLYPHQLSGGQRQRLGIARALAVEPALLICDEPTSALDVSIQAQIINLLIALRRQQGISILFITHDLALAHLIADRVVVMCRGEIVERGTAQQVFSAPRHPYTQQLVKAIPGMNMQDY